MTKLTQWLFVLVLFVSIWLSVIFEQTPLKVTDQTKIWIYLVYIYKYYIYNVIQKKFVKNQAPIFLVALFGVFENYFIDIILRKNNFKF